MKFEIFKSKRNSKFYFNLKARNGQVILTSQGYVNKAGCKKGANAVQKNCMVEDCWQVKQSKNGKHHFNLLSKNKQIVAKSQQYNSKATLVKGMASVKRVAPNAVFVDLTSVQPTNGTSKKTTTTKAKASTTAKRKTTKAKASVSKSKSTTTAKRKTTKAKASVSKSKSTPKAKSTTRKTKTVKGSVSRTKSAKPKASKSTVKATAKRKTTSRKRKTTSKKK